MMVLRQSVSMVALLAVLGCAQPPGTEEVFEREVSSDTSEQIIDSLILAAEASERSGDWGGAAQYWGNLLGKDPTNQHYALGLGNALRRLSQFNESVQVLRDALPYHPEDPALLAAYGKSLLAAGYQPDAVIELQKAAAIAPSDWRVQSALGVAYGMGGQLGLAEQHYRQALILSPGNPTVLSNYGLHKAINGDMRAALLLLEEASNSLDATLQVRQNYALLLVLTGNMEAAETIVRSDLVPEAADRQLAFFESMRGEDLDNLENFVGQGTAVIETEELLAASEGDNVVNLTNIETEDPDAFLDEPEEEVVVEALEIELPEPEPEVVAVETAEPDILAPEIIVSAVEPEPEVMVEEEPVIEAVEAETVPEEIDVMAPEPEPVDDGVVEVDSPEPVIDLIPDIGEDLLVIVPQETVQAEPVQEVEVESEPQIAALPTPPLESALVIEPGDQVVTSSVPEPAVAEADVMASGKRFYRVQLAALSSESAAMNGRDQFSRDLAGDLSESDLVIQQGTAGSGDPTWRVLAGAFARQSDAEALCASIKDAGGDCYVRRDAIVAP